MKYLVLIIVVAIMASCSKPAPRLSERLDSLFNAQVKPNGPGVAALVSIGDSIVFSKYYGIADLKTKEPITDKTLFNLGSISKTFVANGILMLRDEGKLSLNDSVIKYFPEFKNKDIGRKVKISHLLTHTSGLPDIRPVSEQREFYLTANDAENWQPVTQCDSLVFEPGTQFEYSNPAFNGLALIIEKVSGQKWQDFIADRIFKPAGMTTSTITDGPHPQSGVSHGYVLEDGRWSELDYGEEPTFCAAGNGGVWSSVEELIKYQKAMETAAFSTPATILQSKTINSPENWAGKEAPFIGWSWFIEKTPDGVKTVGHTGTQGGFYCHYVTMPDKKILYLMLANFPIERELLNDEVIRILKQEGL
ncbi:MAG TPA: serine hydrolase domain-containing protein [Cyclobacteriaceae bacterium]|nr:serine hydrolase domain-containing protein [Cyclobacteriaceae bacterium]